MKSLRLSLALIAAAFALSALARAEESKPAAAPAGCCKKAAAAGKECAHTCCAASAKDKKNCEKCGGKNEAPSEKTM